MTGLFSFGRILNPDPNSAPSPDALKARRAVAQALAMRGTDASPIGHWTQGAARVADALIGNIEGAIYDRQEKSARRDAQSAFDKIIGVGAPSTDSGGWGPPAGTAPQPAAGAPAAAAPAPSGGYFGRVRAVESPDGRSNPQSGAAGIYQFMPETAQSLAQRTAWGKGMTGDQVLAAINDEVRAGGSSPKQDELMRLYTATSDGVLRAGGFDTTDANRYALHFFGPGGGPSLLRADPNMPVDQWVRSVNWGRASPDAVISQNNLTRFKTVGELRDHIAKSMGGATPVGAADGAQPPGAGIAPVGAADGRQSPGAGMQTQPNVTPGGGAPQIDTSRAMAILANPWLPEGARSVLSAIVGQQLKPREYGFTESGGVIYRTDPRAGTVTAVGGAPKPTATTRTLSAAEVKGLGLPEGAVAQIDHTGKVNVVHQGEQWEAVKAADGRTYMVNKRDPSKTMPVGGEPKPDYDKIDGMRKEVKDLPPVKVYRDIVGTFNSMVKSAKINTRAADLDLVYSLASIMDPGSVVREGEQIMVKRTSGLSEQVLGWINGVNGGGEMTAATRANILQIANNRVQSYRQSYDAAINPYVEQAKGRGWKPEDVLAGTGVADLDTYKVEDLGRTPGAGAAADAPPAAPDNLPVMQSPAEAKAKLKPGQQFRTPDGRTFRVPAASSVTVPMPGGR